MEDLQRVYNQIINEETKAKRKIDRIDTIISKCDKLNREYWCDVRAEAVAFLNGIQKARDIVWKEHTSKVM